ncbi:hypothetical protein HWV62_2717 [Athelia sp. TMB]|nr:hypothetical protein HWV62_2717 [Athelia sp. TMB]
MAPSSELSLANWLLVLLLIFTTYYVFYAKVRRSRLPPGPPGWPLIGNVFDVPKNGPEWIEYQKMGKKLNSDIVYLRTLGQATVVLNSLEAITDLFEKQSSIYSSRYVMVRELMGRDGAFSLMPYGGFWRAHRRLWHSMFSADGTGWHHAHQIRGVNDLLNRFLESPNQWQEHLRYQAGSTILDVAYGIRTLPEDDPYIQTAEEAVAAIADAAIPGRYMVDNLPWLRYVPAWVPGASFQTIAQKANKVIQASFTVPFEELKIAVANGTAKPSFATSCLEQVDLAGDVAYQEKIIQNTSGTMFAALSTFMLAMIMYPKVQAKAQQELDRVLGPGHLPSFGDEDSLPYLAAIIKECLRWEVVLPVSIPRQAMVDDVYKGYHIPAGTILIPNTWAVLNDEKVYPDPSKFDPERFLTPDGKVNHSVPDSEAAFGYGRRICPGRHMARGTVWLTAGSILASFNVEKAVDAQGNVIEPHVEYVPSLIRQPEPFLCSIKPRSKEVEKTIKDLLVPSM